MNLNVFELGLTGSFGNTQLKQLITVGVKDLDLYAIRPHLYKHLAPAGSVYMQVQDSNGRKIKNSETIALSTIASGTGSESYFHGYIRFLIDLRLRRNTQYYLALVSTGYSYSGSAFVGWCNDFDLRKVDPDFSNNAGFNAPLDFELWARKDIRNGVY
jgi:hypothetical protein